MTSVFLWVLFGLLLAILALPWFVYTTAKFCALGILKGRELFHRQKEMKDNGEEETLG